ncbi:MAG: GNAT family N-acetyltransferase [Patescibacteria group bacterium]
MNVTIRQANVADVPAICSLSQSLFEHERQFTDEYDMGWSHGKAGKAFFTRRLKSPSSFILLAVDGDKPVGYALVKLDKFSWRSFNPVADINNLSVDPAYRGQGVGARLIEEAKQVAKKRGARRMTVQAQHKNERALKFYRTQGFTDSDVALLMNLE